MQSCVPGDQKACACPGGTEGVQICAADGSRYESCGGCPGAGSGGGPAAVGTGGVSVTPPGSGGVGSGGVSAAGTGGQTSGGSGGGAGGAVGSGGAAFGSGGRVFGGGTGGAVFGGGTGGASSGTGGGGTGAGSGGAGAGGAVALRGVTITPDATGWVFATTNTLMVQGPWYGYGDGMGADGNAATGICEARGGHAAAACSTVTTPRPPTFANVGGRMCTSGIAAMVIAGAGGLPDYANITGAGIGLDLNNSGGAAPVRGVFNATLKGVVGVAFDLDVVPSPGLRVEFPIPATDGTAAGAGYWGANPAFASSPVTVGTNVVRWSEVRVPGAAPAIAFDPSMVESILFHVPTTTTSAGPYSFCVSNLRMLTI